LWCFVKQEPAAAKGLFRAREGHIGPASHSGPTHSCFMKPVDTADSSVTPQVPVLRKTPLPHGVDGRRRGPWGRIEWGWEASATQTGRMITSSIAAIHVALLLVVPSVITPAVGVPGTGLVTVSAANAATVAVWEWPLAAPHTLVRPYIAPATPYSAGHRGIDIEAHETSENAGSDGGSTVTAESSPDAAAAGPEISVTAPAAGTVHFAGFVVDRPVLSIRHPGGVISSFEPVSTTLAIGDAVREGEAIGTLELGHCSSPCLHFGVRIDGGYVSPLLFLGGVPRAVLLPTRFLK